MRSRSVALFLCLVSGQVRTLAQDASPPQDPEVQAILAAEGDARTKAIVDYLETRFRSNAIFAGQFASLGALGDEAVDTLTAWAKKTPKQTRLGDRFRLTCVRALRDVVKEPSEALITTLGELADDIIEDTEIRNEAVYALAQFGKRERVEKYLARLRKDAESENVVSRAQANNLLATAHYNLREYEQAVEHYDAVLKAFESGKLGFAGQGVIFYNCACSLALAGNKDRAFQRLEQALEANRKDGGSLDRNLLEKDRDITALRADERFAPLVEKYFPKDGAKDEGDKRP